MFIIKRLYHAYYVVRDTFKREVKNTELYKLLKSLGSIKTLSAVIYSRSIL